MTKIAGSVVLITGASSGLGKQLACDVAKRGGIPVLVGRNEERLVETKKKVIGVASSDVAKHVECFVCDVRNKKNVRDVVKEVMERFGRVDVVVNCAGYSIYKSVEETSDEEFRDIFETNFFGTLNVIKEVFPFMIKSKKGHIVNVSSVAGVNAFPKVGAYAASKFAVVGLSEALYYEMKPLGVEVCLVCPGAFESNLLSHPTFKDFPVKARHARKMRVEYVSRVVLDAVERNRFEVIVPFRSKVLNVASKIVGKVYRKKVMRLPR